MSNIQMMLNELSAMELSVDKYEASCKMDILLKTIKKAIEQGVSRSVLIQVDVDINNLELSKDYFMYHWRNDSKTDSAKRESYQFFNTILNRSIKVSDPNHQDSEFLVREKISSKTLLKCYLDEHIALSFSSVLYSGSKILGQISYLDQESTYIIEEAIVQNICVPEHLSEQHTRDFITKVNQQVMSNISTGEEFWDVRERNYTALVFSESVQKQVKSLDKTLLMDCVSKLIVLEQYFSSWDWKYFECKNIPNTTPESVATLKAYKDEHTFETLFGEKVIVSLHIKGDAFDNRVYFYIDYNNQKVVICSVGEHLPCLKYGK